MGHCRTEFLGKSYFEKSTKSIHETTQNQEFFRVISWTFLRGAKNAHSVDAPFAMTFISFLIASSSAPVRSQLVPIPRNRTIPSWSIMI